MQPPWFKSVEDVQKYIQKLYPSRTTTAYGDKYIYHCDISIETRIRITPINHLMTLNLSLEFRDQTFKIGWYHGTSPGDLSRVGLAKHARNAVNMGLPNMHDIEKNLCLRILTAFIDTFATGYTMENYRRGVVQYPTLPLMYCSVLPGSTLEQSASIEYIPNKNNDMLMPTLKLMDGDKEFPLPNTFDMRLPIDTANDEYLLNWTHEQVVACMEQDALTGNHRGYHVDTLPVLNRYCRLVTIEGILNDL